MEENSNMKALDFSVNINLLFLANGSSFRGDILPLYKYSTRTNVFICLMVSVGNHTMNDCKNRSVGLMKRILQKNQKQKATIFLRPLIFCYKKTVTKMN